MKEKTIILYNQLFNKLSKFNQYWINEFENKEEMVKSRISLSLDNWKFDLLVIEIRELEQYFFEQEAEINMIMSLYFKKFYHEYEQHRNDISQYIQILRKEIINHSDKWLDYFLNHNLNNIIIKLDPLWWNILDSHFEIKLKWI